MYSLSDGNCREMLLFESVSLSFFALKCSKVCVVSEYHVNGVLEPAEMVLDSVLMDVLSTVVHRICLANIPVFEFHIYCKLF